MRAAPSPTPEIRHSGTRPAHPPSPPASQPARGLPLRQRLILGAVIGLTMGTLLDAVHIYNGAASYTNVAKIPLLNVAWYVPFEFLFAGVVGVTVRPELDEELERKRIHVPRATVLWALAVLTVAWWASGAFTRHGVTSSAIASVLTLIGVGTWAIFDGTRQGATAAALTAFIGVALESLIVKTGTYHYEDPDLLGLVPQWLPSLYVTACVAVGNLGRHLKYSFRSPAADLPTFAEAPGADTPEKEAA